MIMSEECLSRETLFDKARTYKTATFLGLSAVMVCTAVIQYFNVSLSNSAVIDAYSGAQLVAVMLMPYVISAVIAMTTVVGVISLLPTARVVEPARQFMSCFKEMQEGDLTVRMRLKAEDPLKEVANSFNAATAALGGEIASWKVINRQQWGVLCQIRNAVETGDNESAIRFIEEMERNWDRIAEIEQRLIA
jgi:methyl-accepting chemotaxis protein